MAITTPPPRRPPERGIGVPGQLYRCESMSRLFGATRIIRPCSDGNQRRLVIESRCRLLSKVTPPFQTHFALALDSLLVSHKVHQITMVVSLVNHVRKVNSSSPLSCPMLAFRLFLCRFFIKSMASSFFVGLFILLYLNSSFHFNV